MNSSSSELLAACGEALFGPRWQSEIARLLRVNDRTVRYWVAGTNPIPPGVWGEIKAELRTRVHVLSALTEKLKEPGIAP